MSCELYISLTASDFVDEQVRIHWALFHFKGGRAASFAEHILWQELWSGKMYFASWSNFMEEFVLAFCLENEATTALIRLKSNRYFQGKWNLEAYIDEFKDLVDLSGYCKGTSVHSLTPLFLTMSICIPHSLYTYPTTSVPLRPPSDNRRSSSISRYSMILPTSSQPRLMPHNYHCLHRDRVT
jgi:hypothetical protein